ncbi:SUR7/PalI family-domain-containing protein [Gloeopeniophorella convolvens]|nr:SUR7/PalI family-domain-containing protein [Gloeopeniophorella convolvens]
MACFCRRRHDDYDHDHHHHHRRSYHHNPRHATFTGFCLFAAFVLFLLVGLSLPIIKPIYLLQVDARTSSLQPETSIGTELRFGVWGFCATSDLNKPTLFSNTGDCVGPQLGYTIDDSTISLVTDDTTFAHLVLKGLTVLLVLHPIAAGLAFLTLFPVIASCCVYHFFPWIMSLVLSVVTAIISTIVFAADLALVIVARDKVKDQSVVNVTVDFGNGVWMVLVGTVLTWLAMIMLAARLCRCCGYRR